MTFVAFLLSLALIYWLLLSFLSELTRPEVPETVLRQMEYKRGEQPSQAA